MSGLGSAYLQACWPDDRAIIAAISEEVDKIEAQRREDLATRIANRVVKQIGG